MHSPVFGTYIFICLTMTFPPLKSFKNNTNFPLLPINISMCDDVYVFPYMLLPAYLYAYVTYYVPFPFLIPVEISLYI